MSFLLNLLTNVSTVSNYISTVLNIIAAVILIGALIPPFIDTIKSKKTFFLGIKFFLFQLFGAAFMLANAILNVVVLMEHTDMVVLFGTFIVVNVISLSINSYIFMIKRQNMAEAAARGISEQEYYETVLVKEMESRNNGGESLEENY